MSDQIADAIRKAYIDPIRSVILVDENFPTYRELMVAQLAVSDGQATEASNAPTIDAEPPPHSKEANVAIQLWDACRERGWVCDVENTNFDQTEHLKRADLVVLDYRLNNNSPDVSLDILAQLADADSSRLVILYTKDTDLAGVRRTVAARLRGAEDPDALYQELVKVVEEDEIAELKMEIDKETLDAYLQGDNELVNTRLYGRVPEALRERSWELIKYFCEVSLLANKAKNSRSSRHLVFANAASSVPWLFCDNLFVAFVNKQGEAGGDVFNALETALREWSPSPIHLTLAYARAALTRKGFAVERAVPRDPDLEVGLTFFTLNEEPKRGTQILFDKIWEALGYDLGQDIASMGASLFPGIEVSGSGALSHAKKLCKSERNDQDIIRRLNAFLCSEMHRGPYLRTGTILGVQGPSSSGNEGEVWICSTPLCDLDPRPPSSNTWNGNLVPFRAIRFRRGKLVKASKTVLDKLTRLEHVLWLENGRVYSAHLANSARVETMFVPNDGRIEEDGTVMVHRLSSQANALEVNEHKMNVRGQLRAQYASLVLQQTGQHLSRIGVDFVTPPRPGKKKA